jgi:phospholipid/cholesterol/gamma-HCH transport system ATP-binding protein
MMSNAPPPAIELRHVTKAFGDRRVLDDVSFTVPAGRSIGILGRSGTGKSVTLKHIVGLIAPDRGEVLVEGREITRLSSRDLAQVRRRIGFLFQNAALFDSITVGENVAFPLRRHAALDEDALRARVQQLLDDVGLGGEYRKMPADLSGGMRKRAGLARAMALSPSILLVDEPSAGLDPITSGEVDALLARLREHAGTTLVVVTHNIDSARSIADELIFLDEGRILARGSAEALDRSDVPLVRDFMRAHGTG